MPLFFAKAGPAFTPQQRLALGTLHSQCPPRVRAVNQTVQQVSHHDWTHGNFSGWADNGSILLLEGEWWRHPGAGIHELLHIIFQGLMTSDQQETWGLFFDTHKSLLPTDYARKNPDEAMAESGVAVYRRPLPAGYKAAGVILTAQVKKYAE